MKRQAFTLAFFYLFSENPMIDYRIILNAPPRPDTTTTMSKLSSMFFDEEPEPRPAAMVPTPTLAPAPYPLAADASPFFIFAAPAPTPTPRAASTASNPQAAAAGIPYGSYHQENWSEIEELDLSTVTPCPTCKTLEFWEDVAGNTYCMRCQPLKIQRFRNWMNRRELLLNVHQMQREEDERAQQARAEGRDEFDGIDDHTGDPAEA